jgi:diguanylate cyclase (GGDEF)-like protein
MAPRGDADSHGTIRVLVPGRERATGPEPATVETVDQEPSAPHPVAHHVELGLETLPGRHAFEQEAKRHVAFARRHGHPLCMALIAFDVDVAEESDQWLRHATLAWRDVLRTEDVIGRWSEDEFALVLPNCTTASAVQLCWRLREKTPDEFPFSAGLVALSGDETVRALVARADVCLTQAQAKGPSRTVAEGLVDLD